MTITYPQPTKTKRQRPVPPPVALSPALRADAAISDAQRFLGAAIGQMLMAAIWVFVFSIADLAEFGLAGVLVSAAVLFLLFCGHAWVTMQSVFFERLPYASGQNQKLSFRVKVAMVSALSMVGAFPVAIAAAYVLWKNGAHTVWLTPLIQLIVLLFQVLVAVVIVLRASDAIKYARTQIVSAEADKNEPTFQSRNC